MPTEASAKILVDNLHFPEGPRWRTAPQVPDATAEGKLYFVDIMAGKVMAVDLAGNVETLVEVKAPVGLGFMTDGTLLVTAAAEGKLMALRDGGLETIADVRAAVGKGCGEMVVDKQGRAFFGGGDKNTGNGFDESIRPGPGNMPGFGYLINVNIHTQKTQTVADRMTFANGQLITPDGKTLIVAETFGFRLTAFDIAEDGTLSNRRIWADLGVPPDGICFDEEGCVWVSVFYYSYGGPGGYIRIEEGGKVRDRIDVADYSPYACTLGGENMSTLFLCESAIFGQPRHPGDGRIRSIEVEVPGTGSP